MTRYLHTMIRVSDPDATISFFDLIGVQEVRRFSSEQGRFTLIFLAAPGDEGVAEVELTYNWPAEGEPGETYTGGGNFCHPGHPGGKIFEGGAAVVGARPPNHRPPRDGHMAFVKSPDGISVELLQDGHLPPQEPWASMENTGTW